MPCSWSNQGSLHSCQRDVHQSSQQALPRPQWHLSHLKSSVFHDITSKSPSMFRTRMIMSHTFQPDLTQQSATSICLGVCLSISPGAIVWFCLRATATASIWCLQGVHGQGTAVAAAHAPHQHGGQGSCEHVCACGACAGIQCHCRLHCGDHPGSTLEQPGRRPA